MEFTVEGKLPSAGKTKDLLALLLVVFTCGAPSHSILQEMVDAPEWTFLTSHHPQAALLDNRHVQTWKAPQTVVLFLTLSFLSSLFTSGKPAHSEMRVHNMHQRSFCGRRG